MLQKLPKEILLLVLEQISGRNDLKRLCEVSRTLYDYAIPKLYENIVIWAEDERHLDRAEVEPFLGTGSKPTGHLTHVRIVEIRSRFHYLLEDRCLHHKDLGFYLRQSDFEIQPRFGKLTTNLMPLFEQLREESLRSFSWEMGTCVPFQILGDQGYMNRKQSSIENISLITGGECPINIDGENPINLSAFCSLRYISWTGLRSAEDFDALNCALKNNLEHLRELRLDLVNWPEEWGGDEPENSFANQILKLSADQFETIFPALEILSLSNVSLENAGKGTAYALNFSGLSSLTLRYCDGSEELLTAVIDSGQTIRLSSLEVVCGPSDYDYDMCHTLSIFLEAFQGLRDLFVTLAGPVQTLDFWRTIAHHKSTLTRFVCHQNSVNFNEDSSRFGEQMDLPDLSLLPEDITELDQSESRHPFAALNPECIGLGCTPDLLKSILAPFATTQTLKVLHIRKSGSDMEGHTLRSRRILSGSWDLDSDDDSMMDDDLRADPDPDVMIACDTASEDGSSNENTSNDGKPPSMIHSIASSESFDIAEILRLPGELLRFANWAFGPNGLPTLQVLAFGDFSYSGRFHSYNKLFCRRTSPIRSPENDISQQSEGGLILTFRLTRPNDRELWDLINRNTEFLEACPTDWIVTGY